MTAKKPEMTGSFELAGFNVYSARFLDGYLYSEYFLQVKGDEAATLFGNCLAKIENERVTEIYIEK
jgi:hypothetical protein